MKRLFFALASLAFLYGCSSDFKTLETPPNGVQLYTSSIISEGRVAVSGYAKALENGHLFIVLGIDNQSSDTLDIAESVQLQTDGGLRSEIKSFIVHKGRIEPNTFDTLKLLFHPINNLELFQRTGYQGDLSESYFLDLSFVEGFYNKNLKFSATNWWFSYKEQSHEKSIQSFAIEADDADTWQLSDNEILARGVLFKMKAYQMLDSLTLKIEIINHGEVEAGIFLSKLNSALNLNAEKETNHIFWIAKGNRWEQRVTIYHPSSDSVSLPADLIVDKFNVPLWPSMVKLKNLVEK